MTKKVITIAPAKTTHEAARLMKKHDIGCLIVLERKRIAGIVTERDLLNKVTALNKTPSKVKVQEVMTSQVITSRKNTTIYAIASIMSENRIRRVVITDDSRKDNIIGIITIHDLLLGPLKQQGPRLL